MRDNPFGLLLAVVVVGQLLVVVGLLLRARPQRGVLALALLAPFDGLLLLVPHPAVVDGWKEALVLATLGAAVIAPASVRHLSPGRPRPGWAPALLGLLLLGTGSALLVGGLQGVIGMKVNFFYLLLLPALWLCPLGARDRDRLVSLLMLTGVLAAIVGLTQQALGGEALNRLGYEYNTTIRTAGGLLRSFSTFNQPFPFGLYEMLVLLVGIPVALTEPGRRRNRVFLLATPLLVVGMLSSIVRAAILGLVVGAVFLWWHRHRVLAHIVPVLLAVALFVPAAIYVPLLSPTSLGQRSAGWSQTFGEVLAAPFGNGIGASGSAAEKAAQVAGLRPETYQPDNYYFKTAYELGPIGLWLLVLVLVAAFGAARRAGDALETAARDDPVVAVEARRDAALAAGIAASVLAAAASSIVATYFEIFPLDLFFWLLLGVLPSLTPASRTPPSPSAPAAAGSRPTSASSSVP